MSILAIGAGIAVSLANLVALVWEYLWQMF